ncbi:MAG: hypothetical protein ACLUEK_01930 [Oscillospiraceae bacterium]
MPDSLPAAAPSTRRRHPPAGGGARPFRAACPRAKARSPPRPGHRGRTFHEGLSDHRRPDRRFGCLEADPRRDLP